MLFFFIYLYLLIVVIVLLVLPPPIGKSKIVVVSVSFDFSSFTDWDTPFHRIAFDADAFYFYTDGDGLRHRLKDFL